MTCGDSHGGMGHRSAPRMSGRIWRAICVVVVIAGGARADEVPANRLFDWPHFLRHAHSHNDYEQPRPLLDALAAGVTSIEVDLFLEKDLVLVAHDRGKWRGGFEALYLRPLDELWQSDKLPARNDRTFLLWLDLKEENPALRRHLHRLLEAYPVTSRSDPERVRVQVILTGNQTAKGAFVAEYPSELVSRDSNTFSEDDPPSSPAWTWYALDWKKIGAWNGIGHMPAGERDRLRELTGRIRSKGRKVRLWNHPATFEFWQEAQACGVDLLGTDTLPVADKRASPRRE